MIRVARSSKSRRTALIVEDELLAALDLVDLVRDCGFEPLGSVGSAEEALRCAAARRPDVVLMDVRLRGAMDGVQAAEVIALRWGLPVVFLTACHDAGAVARMQKVLPVAILIKPVARERLCGVLDAIAAAQEAADRP